MKSLHRMPESKQRVWEIDALRGFLILAVLINHLNITVNAFCINGYYNIDSSVWASVTDPLHVWFAYNADGVLQSAEWVITLREICTYPAVDLFFVISGVSCVFSRSSLKRGLKMLAGALIVSGFTKLLAIWTGNPNLFIRFGVLQCYAYCHIVYYFLLEKRKSRTLMLVAIPVFVIGYYLRYHPIYSEFSLLYPFGVCEIGAVGSDYWPVFPMLGWMLLGVVLGRRFYAETKSLMPFCPINKWTKSLQWLGKYSGQIYLAHIFIYTAVFCGAGWLLDLF